MTTVAYRNGIMAADSQVTFGGSLGLAVPALKIGRSKDGCLVGATGNTSECQGLLGFLKKNNFDPDHQFIYKALSAMVVDQNRNMFIFNHDVNYFSCLGQVEFFSVGSGRDLAIGAMHFGASAKDAVATAIVYDIGTSGPIRTMKL